MEPKQLRDSHFVTFDNDGWFIEHSYACRLMGTMGTCDYNAAIRRLPADDLYGRFMITFDNDGDTVLVSTGKAMSLKLPQPDARQDYPPIAHSDLRNEVTLTREAYETMCDEINVMRALADLDAEEAEQAEGPGV